MRIENRKLAPIFYFECVWGKFAHGLHCKHKQYIQWPCLIIITFKIRLILWLNNSKQTFRNLSIITKTRRSKMESYMDQLSEIVFDQKKLVSHWLIWWKYLIGYLFSFTSDQINTRELSLMFDIHISEGQRYVFDARCVCHFNSIKWILIYYWSICVC